MLGATQTGLVISLPTANCYLIDFHKVPQEQSFKNDSEHQCSLVAHYSEKAEDQPNSIGQGWRSWLSHCREVIWNLETSCWWVCWPSECFSAVRKSSTVLGSDSARGPAKRFQSMQGNLPVQWKTFHGVWQRQECKVIKKGAKICLPIPWKVSFNHQAF